MFVNNQGQQKMRTHTAKFPLLPLLALIVLSLVVVARPDRAAACDAGVARRTGGIAEIDLVSAVVGSTVVRSLPSQEGAGAPDTIQIIHVAAAVNVVLASGPATADGQYAIAVPIPLVAGQRIQAFNSTKGYYSATVTVSAAQPPVISEPLVSGVTQVTGIATPGSRIEIRNAITNSPLGPTGTAAPKTGLFSITLSQPLPLFHTIRARDVTKGLTGKNVSILNLLGDHIPLRSSCGISSVLMGVFTKKTFACGLSRPREITLDSAGNPLIVVGSAPSDRAYSLMPSGTFRLAPTTGALALFAPVSGVGLKPARVGSTFPTGFYIARPRVFNPRGKVTVHSGDGEIFRVDPTSSAITVFTRALDFSPTGMAFPPAGSPFGDNLLISDIFGAGVRRITPTGVISPLTPLTAYPGLQGLAFDPSGNNVYVTQPSGGRILRMPSSGPVTTFASGMMSPTALTFGPGGPFFGTDLYVADAGRGIIWRVNNSGARTAFASGLGSPFGLVFRPTTPPSLFVTDYLSGNVIQITPNTR
jgi:DNA-binding beta-propeller fold protein YncE